MARLLLFNIFYFASLLTFAIAKPTPENVLSALDRELGKEKTYIAQKKNNIAAFHEQLEALPKNDLKKKFAVYSDLYEEYKSFNYDSAFYYVNKLHNIAYQLQDESKINESKIRLGFILLSSGMFKEAFDSLSTVELSAIPKISKQEYFALMARAYYDLADFNKDNYYTPLYTKKGNAYVDSLLAIAPPESYNFLYFRGLKNARMTNLSEGLSDLEKLTQNESLTLHQQAVLSSTLSDFYLRVGNTEKAQQLLAKAAIFDLKSATKETAAILILANLLYEQGDIKRAYRYTKKALDDANFYGARHRKIQVGSVLPIIEEEKLNIVESQKELLLFYLMVAVGLGICVIVFAIIILKQLRKLKWSKKAIDEANVVLHETNHTLQETNEKLLEANKIKEEYIGYYFNINSEYIDKIDKFKRSIEKNLAADRIENIKYIVSNINLKKERNELFTSFDKVFLKLFPDFLEEFNSMFSEEDQIKLPKNQLLNTDLRIFALIRMGIHDNDKIAKILNYSVNTIYAYKTRIKNKAIIPNEEFEQRVMDIKQE